MRNKNVEKEYPKYCACDGECYGACQRSRDLGWNYAIKEVKRKLPCLLGFEDYDEHVHTYATENSGKCGICGLSWKKTTEYGYYNQAIYSVKRLLKSLKVKILESE